ncbi:MAG: DUF1080 domain-containing protein [Flammeovirgaceae bacterium]|nr:DUF1080 domain-containing protein [Flammeovirgaceae bacterium]
MKNYFKILTLAIASGLFLASCQKPAQEDSAATEVAANTLTEAENADGWELLFNGTSLDGWKRYNHDTIGPLWSVKDGMIICDGSGLGKVLEPWADHLPQPVLLEILN